MSIKGGGGGVYGGTGERESEGSCLLEDKGVRRILQSGIKSIANQNCCSIVSGAVSGAE